MYNNFVREKILEEKFCTPYDEDHHKSDEFTGENTQNKEVQKCNNIQYVNYKPFRRSSRK